MTRWRQALLGGGESDSEGEPWIPRQNRRSHGPLRWRSESSDDEEPWNRRPRQRGRRRWTSEDEEWNPCLALLCVWCLLDGRLFGLRCCALGTTGIMVLAGVWIGITRNMYCDTEALRGLEAPYGGEILPSTLWLAERKRVFQFTKIVDVYDVNNTQVGYFYDINLFFIMRFGFSDANHRIWFEARYASFFSRFKPWIEYNLQRCDASEGHLSSIYQLREDWWQEIQGRIAREFCIINCFRLFDVAVRTVDTHVPERILPPYDFGDNPVARVRFDSTITPTLSIDGIGIRHAWWMRAKQSGVGKQPILGFANESFKLGDMTNQYTVLARWELWTNESAHYLPNWILAYMAVLDNVEEDSE